MKHNAEFEFYGNSNNTGLLAKETFKRLEFAKNNNTAEEFFTKLFEILNEPEKWKETVKNLIVLNKIME